MDLVHALADHSIRRALGFGGLAIGTVMLSLSFDMALALRAGADMLALACVTLLLVAWRTGRRDMRRTELWSLLQANAGEFARRLPRAEAQALLSGALRRRLVWHAERIGAAALAFYLGSGLLGLFR